MSVEWVGNSAGNTAVFSEDSHISDQNPDEGTEQITGDKKMSDDYNAASRNG